MTSHSNFDHGFQIPVEMRQRTDFIYDKEDLIDLLLSVGFYKTDIQDSSSPVISDMFNHETDVYINDYDEGIFEYIILKKKKPIYILLNENTEKFYYSYIHGYNDLAKWLSMFSYYTPRPEPLIDENLPQDMYY